MTIMMPVWIIALVISVIGTIFIWSLCDGGDLDFTQLFYGPLGVVWFLATWLVFRFIFQIAGGS